jgi:hypothetical protein
MVKNSGREARQNNIALRTAKMDMDKQFRFITDLMPDVADRGALFLAFEAEWTD